MSGESNGWFRNQTETGTLVEFVDKGPAPSFAGELSEPFETELDTAYEVCDAALGITSEP